MNPPAQRGVWIIGAGYLGRRLGELLRGRGEAVLTVDLSSPADVVGDAAEEEVLRQAFRQLAPRVVCCCQSTRGGGVETYRRSYVDVVRQATRVAAGARLLFCSSASVYGKRDGALTSEESPCFPETERATVLLQAEQEVMRAGGVVARLAALYGEGRCELLRRHLCGEAQLPGPPSRILNYLYREDAARALLLLWDAARLPWALFNVCSESLAKGEAYAMLSRLTGRPPSFVSAAVSRRGASDLRLDCRRLQSLGWKPEMSLASFVEAEMSRRLSS